MKFMHLSALALAGTFTVLAIGCAKTKDNSKETPLHNYTLKESCDQKPIVSESPDQDCAALQQAIASGCEVEKRKAIYEKRCEQKNDSTTTTTIPVFADDKDKKAEEPKKEGTDKKADTDSFFLPTNTDKEAEKKELLSDDTVTTSSKDKSASTTTTVKASEKATTLVNTVVLDDNKEFVASIKLSAAKADSKLEFLAAPTTIRCADNLELAKQDVGVILVGDGKLVLTKDMSLEISEDPTETAASLVECISTEKEKSKETLGLTAKALKVGQSTTDATLGYSKKEGKETVQSQMSVSCHDDATKAALSGKNGLQMLKGTSVLLSNETDKKQSLISCQ